MQAAIKFLGICMVIGAASAGGILAADKIKNRYEQLRYLKNLICRLRSEIRYARSYLGETFRQMGGSARTPYKEWLLDMSRQMEERRCSIFAKLWEEKTAEYLNSLGFPEEVFQSLISLGSQLGIMDTDMQIKALEIYEEELELAMEEMREEMQEKIRLCRCLGVMSGIFITVLLL